MQRLGRVLHLSSSRNLIIKADVQPKIGVRVVDKNLKPVGLVFDVIGPVPSPYVVVKSKVSEPQLLIRNVLYTVPSNEERKEKQKYGR